MYLKNKSEALKYVLTCTVFVILIYCNIFINLETKKIRICCCCCSYCLSFCCCCSFFFNLIFSAIFVSGLSWTSRKSISTMKHMDYTAQRTRIKIYSSLYFNFFLFFTSVFYTVIYTLNIALLLISHREHFKRLWSYFFDCKRVNIKTGWIATPVSAKLIPFLNNIK